MQKKYTQYSLDRKKINLKFSRDKVSQAEHFHILILFSHNTINIKCPDLKNYTQGPISA